MSPSTWHLMTRPSFVLFSRKRPMTTMSARMNKRPSQRTSEVSDVRTGSGDGHPLFRLVAFISGYPQLGQNKGRGFGPTGVLSFPHLGQRLGMTGSGIASEEPQLGQKLGIGLGAVVLHRSQTHHGPCGLVGVPSCQPHLRHRPSGGRAKKHCWQVLAGSVTALISAIGGER